MSHKHPALFIGGPADGMRMFVHGRDQYHRVIKKRPLPPSLMYDCPSMYPPVHHDVVEYQHIDVLGGHRIFVPRGESHRSILAQLVAGYVGERTH